MNYLHWDEQTITDFSAENINAMYDRGFVFTRLGKGTMQQTRSVRVDLSQFELSSENRRILRKTEGLTIAPHSLPTSDYHWSIGKLAKDFYEIKFGAGIFSANKIKELLTDSEKSNFNTLLSYQLNNETIGYAVCYETPEIIHYSYPFYDLENTTKDMGMGMMTRAIVWAKEHKKKYIYLGSAQRESDTYKFQFSGIEVCENGIWREGRITNNQ